MTADIETQSDERHPVSDLDYETFIQSKRLTNPDNGITVELEDLNPLLFDFQKIVTRWALHRGRAAIWARYGLGKTPMQLEWARHMCNHTGMPTLIFAPLGVNAQTVREGVKFGVPVTLCRSQAGVRPGVNITNYEMREHFIPDQFGALIIDESSILKALNGKTKQALIDFAQYIPYRLACTATPAPNDWIEILNHSEYLGVMQAKEVRALFFTQDGNSTTEWRLKHHAEHDFWEWVASWAVAFRSPADLGYSAEGFNLPPLTMQQITVEGTPVDGQLFPTEVQTLTQRRAARKGSLSARVQATANLVNSNNEQWLVWCDLNEESKQLTKAIKGAVEVTGSDKPEHKVQAVLDFLDGRTRVIVSKPTIYGFGLNLQCCHNMAFVGLSDSWEQVDQAKHRIYRFGQTQPVNGYVVVSENEGAVVANQEKKERQAQAMLDQLIDNLHTDLSIASSREEMTIEYDSHVGHDYTWLLGDSFENLDKLEDNSVGLTVTSIPFAGMYTYTNSPADVGNNRDHAELTEHLKYLMAKVLLKTMPGRGCAIHLVQEPVHKNTEGYSGFRDFRGEIIQAMKGLGWIPYGEVTIDKDPQVKASRTKELGLLFRTLSMDSAKVRPALGDYLLYFLKPGDNPIPIRAGINKKYSSDGWITDKEWIEWAHPIWVGIRETNVLNVRSAREETDERHLCPLQLDVIVRAIKLWSAPGDLVIDPFGGIASTLYTALTLNRRAWGSELKRSYWETGKVNIQKARAARQQTTMFDLFETEPALEEIELELAAQ